MIRLLLISLLLCLSACAPTTLSEGTTVGAYQYRIGTGDRLRVQTYGEQRLSGEFAVGSDGALSFPLVGDFPAAGKTLAEFKDEFTARLGSEFLKNPQVSIEIINFRSVYILGEVAKPGEFSFNSRMSVFALVAKAGGFTYRANQKYAYIRHENDNEEQAVRLTSATAVQPGDTIRIPERSF